MKFALLLFILIMPLFTMAQAPTNDSTKLTAPPAIHPLSMSSLYMRGGNASNAQVGFLDLTTGKWIQLLTGYQANHGIGSLSNAFTLTTSQFNIISSTLSATGVDATFKSYSFSSLAPGSSAGNILVSDGGRIKYWTNANFFTNVGAEDASNKVTTIDSSFTHYPSTSAIRTDNYGSRVNFSSGASNPIVISSYQATYAALYGNHPTFVVHGIIGGSDTIINGVQPAMSYSSSLLNTISFYISPINFSGYILIKP